MKKLFTCLLLGLSLCLPSLAHTDSTQFLTLKKNQMVAFAPYATIEVTDISDSRCPEHVFCFWEGDVSVTLNIITLDEERSFSLRLHLDDSTKASIEGYEFSIEAVNPYPNAWMKNPEQEVVLEVRSLD